VSKMNCGTAIRITYSPKRGEEGALLALLRKHWPLLKKSKLVTDDEAKIYRTEGRYPGSTSFVEDFSWRHLDSQSIALRTPAIIELWRQIAPLLEPPRQV
jgi:hypothetical protein